MTDVADAPAPRTRARYVPPRYSHAVVRRPARSLGDGLTTQQRGQPDIALAREQHAAYVAALRSLGVSVEVLDPDEAFPDCCFVEDVAVIHKGVAIVTHPGAPSRRGEVASAREVLAGSLPIVEMGQDESVLLDGGDVLIYGNRMLVGLSRHTNEKGLQRLTAIVREINPEMAVTGVPLSGVLHLKTGMTALHRGIFLRDPACQMSTPPSFARVQTLPGAEGYAANVLPVNDGVLVAKDYPTVAELARTRYATVIELDMSEFHKMDGSLTCLSLLW
jgi:dimethylargininase